MNKEFIYQSKIIYFYYVMSEYAIHIGQWIIIYFIVIKGFNIGTEKGK